MQLIIDNPMGLMQAGALVLLLLLALALLAKPVVRYIVKQVANDAISKLLTEEYTKNLAEFLPSLKRFSVLNAIELSLRAEEGKVIGRPLGSPKHFLGFENLMFSPRQMGQLSLPATAQVDMQVTIGPQAEKPMAIQIPLMISAMAFGLALSEQAKIALARASKQLGTAICSGEGPLLPEESGEAGKYVLQISRWPWGGRTQEQIMTADMLEVQMGQGADMGSAVVEAVDLEGKARILGGLAEGEQVESLPAPPGVKRPEDWPEFMERLRKKAHGIPIALKLMATDYIEEELAIAVELGFDAVIIDGAQGGSHASPPIKQDDFGIPSLHALIRARRFLGDRPISLIVAGGYFTPGQCLKALALGADAIYLATVPLFALVHNQSEKVSPYEPLTTLIFYNSATKTELNIETAVKGVVNTLTSMTLEMEEALRGLGKSSLKELTAADLVALDRDTARVSGVRHVMMPRSRKAVSPEEKAEKAIHPRRLVSWRSIRKLFGSK